MALDEALERIVLLEGTTSGEELNRELITLLDNGKALLYTREDDDEGAELGKYGCDDDATPELMEL